MKESAELKRLKKTLEELKISLPKAKTTSKERKIYLKIIDTERKIRIEELHKKSGYRKFSRFSIVPGSYGAKTG